MLYSLYWLQRLGHRDTCITRPGRGISAPLGPATCWRGLVVQQVFHAAAGYLTFLVPGVPTRLGWCYMARHEALLLGAPRPSPSGAVQDSSLFHQPNVSMDFVAIMRCLPALPPSSFRKSTAGLTCSYLAFQQPRRHSPWMSCCCGMGSRSAAKQDCPHDMSD